MLPQKYHAIAFLSILVMLLLLGLHLLGFSFLGGGNPANAVALARNSSGSSSSPTGSSSTLNSNAVYRHPIVYDKLTGATNNQINDVLGSGSKQDQFPLDHYQQQQQQQLNLNQNPFKQFGGPDVGNDPFSNHLGHPFRPLAPLPPPPPPPLGPQLSRHHGHHHPPPPPLPPPPVHMMTTQSPQQQQPVVNAEQRSQLQDSIPSASSVNNNGATRPQNTSQPLAAPPSPPPQLAHYYQQQPVYYTPPIFTYSNFDGPQQPGTPQTQLPPLGVPEVPLSVDEFNARQNRLRQLNGPTTDNDKQQMNLLADPQAQQRHKQQMLDRQLLFGPSTTSNQQPPLGFLQPTTSNPVDNYTTSAYYPDPALYARLQQQQQQHSPPNGSIRPPYAQQMPPPAYPQSEPSQLETPSQQMKHQNRLMASQRQPDRLSQTGGSIGPRPQPQQHPPPLIASSVVRSGQQAPLQQQMGSSSPVRTLQLQQEPSCARQLQAPVHNLELANSSSQFPALICNEDPDYPTTDIMRALEQYASERSIEQLIPQQLVQLLTQSRVSSDLQRQVSLDPLQSSINVNAALQRPPDGDQQHAPGVFPSANYESLCRSTSWIAQPRRAKNLSGHWKVVVNLPGHKYRGIAISQMVRLEECVRPNGECSISASATPASTSAVVQLVATGQRQQTSIVSPRSRCLQNYGNQRLLAWSHQQGLHFDLFRVPIACSCHIRRS